MSQSAAGHAPLVARHDAPAPPPRSEVHFGAASNGKIGMWVFLLTDGMGFAGLLLGYAILRAGSDVWPNPTERLGIPFTAVMTFVLICSSVTMVMALAGAQEKNRKALIGWLTATIVGGIFFLCGQVYEYTHLITGPHKMGISLDQFAGTFYIVTGFHGCHVLSGVIYLTVMLIRSIQNKADANLIEIAGLFWHFVDLVWILVFTFIYLLPIPSP